MAAKKTKKKVDSKNSQPKTAPVKQEAPAVPAGMALVDVDYLSDLKKKAESGGMGEIEKDIVDEALKITKGEVSSCYQLCVLGKELIAANRARS